jgi:hypothetical protein
MSILRKRTKEEETKKIVSTKSAKEKSIRRKIRETLNKIMKALNILKRNRIKPNRL